MSLYKEATPNQLSTHPASPLLTDRFCTSTAQGEQPFAVASPEFAAAEEEKGQRLRAPQAKPGVPAASPSSTALIARLAVVYLVAGKPQQTPTIAARFSSRRSSLRKKKSPQSLDLILILRPRFAHTPSRYTQSLTCGSPFT